MSLANCPESYKVCIVGGGNAAHTLAALLPSRGHETRVLASYGDEADRINAGIEEQGCMKATFANHNTPAGLVEGRPVAVSKHADNVVPMSDVLIMPLPSFAYRSVLTEIKPHLRKGMMIGVTPGQGGFDWIAKEVLGDLFQDIVFFALLPMPFNCRITEFGKHVAVQTFKENYRVAYSPQTEDVRTQVLHVSEALFGKTEAVGHFLTATLYPINAIIHPQRLFVVIGENYKKGDLLADNPLFYKVLAWAQGHMGKEYMVDGRLVGKDVPETSAPQAFGIHSLQALH